MNRVCLGVRYPIRVIVSATDSGRIRFTVVQYHDSTTYFTFAGKCDNTGRRRLESICFAYYSRKALAENGLLALVDDLLVNLPKLGMVVLGLPHITSIDDAFGQVPMLPRLEKMGRMRYAMYVYEPDEWVAVARGMSPEGKLQSQ